MTRKGCHQLDLSEIALKENYKMNLLARFGGKIKYYLKVAAFCDRVKRHYRLRPFFEEYDLRELHRCLVDILNSAFQALPDSFDLNAHFRDRHFTLLNAGMTASDFDVLVLVYEELLWDMALDKSLVKDAVQLLQALRRVFDTTHRTQESSNNEYNGLSLWESVEQRKQEKIASRRRKIQLQRKPKNKRATEDKSIQCEESQKSACTEDMTILSADQLYDEDWDHEGYQSWNNVVY